MKILHKFLYIVTIILFFLSLGLTLVPSNLLMIKKPDLKIILLDVSLSNYGFDLDSAKEMKSLDKSIPEDALILRGIFSDSVVYLDKNPFKLMSNKESVLHDFQEAQKNIIEQLNAEATNYEAVIKNVLRDYSEDYNCDILLITDGKQTQGDVIKTRNQLELLHARVQFLPTNFANLDMSIVDCDLPKIISTGSEVLGTLIIKSNFENKGTIINISVNNKIVKSLQTDIAIGTQKLSFVVPLSKAVHNRVEMELIYDDSLKKNNKLVKYVKNIAKGKVLLVSNRNLDLPENLQQSFELVEPLLLTEMLSKLAQYECIWLDDIAWLDLVEKEKVERLETYVINGGKLFVSGGPHSFAFGDYGGTLLEKILPVQTNPNGLLSLMVCIDASGSMEQQVHGKRKIDISVSALLELIKGLQNKDEVGLMFSQNSKKPNDFISLMVKENFELELRKKYNQIPLPSGGTFLKPGVQAAFDSLAKSNKELRVVIFITDGESQEKDYQDLFKQFKDIHPEIVLLVIGAGLNEKSLLIQDAKKIFGEHWEPIRVEEKGWFNLKDSFKDAFKKIASGFSATGKFSTKLSSINAAFRFLTVQEEDFFGTYLKSSLKNGATSLIEVDEANPLLAVWSYGQGKVLSLQTGIFSDWSQEYFQNAQGSEVLNGIFNWMIKNSVGNNDFSIKNQAGALLFTFFSEDSDLENETILPLEVQGRNLNLYRFDSNVWQTSLDYDLIPNEWYMLNSIKYKVSKVVEGLHVEIENGEIPPVLPSEYLSLDNPALFWSLIGAQGVNLKIFERWDKSSFQEMKKDEDITNLLAFAALLFFLCMLFVRGRMF